MLGCKVSVFLSDRFSDGLLQECKLDHKLFYQKRLTIPAVVIDKASSSAELILQEYKMQILFLKSEEVDKDGCGKTSLKPRIRLF